MDRPPISGQTLLAGVIGDPVRHSLSPAIHNRAFAELGLDWRYLAFPVAANHAADAVAAMRTLGIRGLNVTMPHKADVAATVDRLTPAAAALGVCNTLFWDGDDLVGDSTDGDGFVAYFQSDAGHEIKGRSVVVLGAGGAARSIIEALGRQAPASIYVVNRTMATAEAAAALAPMATVATLEAIESADILINTTAVGMTGSDAASESLVPLALLRPDLVVADIVYQPRQTPLLVAAEQVGAQTVGGLGMLVRQAALAFEHWTGCQAPVAAMFAAVSGSD